MGKITVEIDEDSATEITVKSLRFSMNTLIAMVELGLDSPGDKKLAKWMGRIIEYYGDES